MNSPGDRIDSWPAPTTGPGRHHAQSEQPSRSEAAQPISRRRTATGRHANIRRQLLLTARVVRDQLHRDGHPSHVTPSPLVSAKPGTWASPTTRLRRL